MRRDARKIWVVNLFQNEDADSEDWQGEVRFSTERAAAVFAREAEKWEGIDVVTGPHVAPLFFSAKAAVEHFR